MFKGWDFISPLFLFKNFVYICNMKKGIIDRLEKKIVIQEEVFRKQYDGQDAFIPFGDLPTDLQPSDKMLVYSDPGWQSENNAWDPFTEIVILRDRIETDDEFNKRQEKRKAMRAEFKKRRYENYLKLKEEFENE